MGQVAVRDGGRAQGGDRAAGHAGEEDEDFLDVLLRLREDGADGLELTDDRIKGILEDMIGGGTETTIQTLEWAMAAWQSS